MASNRTAWWTIAPTALTTFLVTASVAHAGSFEVAACDAAGGVNHSWAPIVMSDPWVTAYGQCPSGGDPNGGLVSRNVSHTAPVGGPVSARLVFTAPAGTTITSLRASDDFYSASAGWEAALSADSRIVRGCGVGNPPPCRWNSRDEVINVGHASQLGIDVYCPGKDCPLSSGSPDHSYAVAAARVYSAVVTIQDDTLPTIGQISSTLWTDGWKRGTQTVTFDATDNTGIRQTTVLVDGQPVAQRSHACDPTLTAPCAQGGDSYPVSTAPLSDGSHQFAVVATDSAGNQARSSRVVLVDNSPPGAPQSLTVDGGQNWRRANSFSLHWTNPKVDGAPVAGVAWQLCPTSGDPGGCVTGTKPGDGITSLDALQVPHDGDWVARIFLVDSAGNQSLDNAAPPVHLRVDGQPPTGASFAPRDPTNPASVVIQATDPVSGIGSGSLDIKPQSTGSWISVPATLAGGRLVAMLPDEQLPDGTYDLRGHAVDQAGNETTTSTLADGSPMTVTLPVRAKTSLLGGHPYAMRHTGRRTASYATSVHLAFGSQTTIVGRLVDTSGKPMPGTGLQVLEQQQLPKAPFKSTRGITTSKSGAFFFRTSRGGTARVVRVRYPGTALIRAAQLDIRLDLAATSTMQVSRHTAMRGSVVHFSGHLLGGHLPAGGKLVQLQALVNGRWQVFANPRANRHGRWQHAYRFIGSYRTASLMFRLRIPRDPSYPFAAGTSPVARINVRGP